MLNEYPKNDSQFETRKIIEITPDIDGWEITFDDKWCLFLFRKYKVKPKVGDSVRLYFKGIGYDIRGLFINGKKVFYRTEKQQEQKRKK